MDYEKTIKKILTNDFGPGLPHLSKAQLATLQRYAEYYANKRSPRGGRTKTTSVCNVLWCLRSVGLYLRKPYKQATKQDIISFFTVALAGKKLSTISARKAIVRSFYRWLYGIKAKHRLPAVVDHELLIPERVKNTVKPHHLITRDELMRMVNVCYETRSKAILMILYEGGLRAAELASANVQSVESDEVGCRLIVERSKTKTRPVRLIDSAPYLREWLQQHPYKEDPQAPLFIGLRKHFGKRLQSHSINLLIKRLLKRAGIEKRGYPHLMRHCSITTLARQGMDLYMLAKRNGITLDTLQKVYLHYDDRDYDSAYCDVKGVNKEERLLKQEEAKRKLAPKKCQYCSRINPFEVHYCKYCNRPVDMQTFVELDIKREEEMREMKQLVEHIPMIKTLIENFNPQAIREELERRKK